MITTIILTMMVERGITNVTKEMVDILRSQVTFRVSICSSECIENMERLEICESLELPLQLIKVIHVPLHELNRGPSATRIPLGLLSSLLLYLGDFGLSLSFVCLNLILNFLKLRRLLIFFFLFLCFFLIFDTLFFCFPLIFKPLNLGVYISPRSANRRKPFLKVEFKVLITITPTKEGIDMVLLHLNTHKVKKPPDIISCHVWLTETIPGKLLLKLQRRKLLSLTKEGLPFLLKFKLSIQRVAGQILR